MDKQQDRKIGSVKGAISSYRQQILEGKPTNKKFQTNYAERAYTKTRELHQAKRETIKFNESRKPAESEAESKLSKKEWSCEDSDFAEVVRELESVKVELSKLKQDMSSILEEKKRAEKETEFNISKTLSHSRSIEAIKNEIEEINEEHVLVELARLEAIKEQREIEAQRKQNAEKHSAQIEETRKIIQSMIQQIEDTNELVSTKDEASLMESITREMEETRTDLDSIQAESYDFMASMDIVRNEYKHVTEETERFKTKEEKANATIQNLTSKLLRAKSKLESTSAASEKAKSNLSNLTATIKQIKSEAKAAEIEQSLISKETILAKAEIERTESEIISKEERLQAAMQDLKAVKSSEATALEKLKWLVQETIRNRASASQNSSTISISKFEYDYLKGHASAAIEIADKKVAAARLWVEALKANEKEIQIKTDLLRKESREQKNMVEEDEFEKWRKQTGSEKLRRGNVKSASPLMDASPRSKSFTVRRRKKVAPNLAKFLNRRSMENNL